MPSDNQLLTIRNRKERGQTLGESDNVEFFVKRVSFSRQTRFRLDDHLFQFTMISHSRRQPLLSSLITKLKIGIIKLIIELQLLYDRESHHQMYLTFDDSHFTRGGINTGNYSIHSDHVKNIDDDLVNMAQERADSEEFENDPQNIDIDDISDKQHAALIATDCLNILASVLRSYDHIKLDESFHIFFRVLSVPHMNQKRKENRLRSPKKLAGIMDGSRLPVMSRRFMTAKNTNLFQVPQNSLLTNCCLLVAVIIGFYYKKYLQYKYSGDFFREAQQYKMLSRLRSEDEQKSAKATKALADIIHKVCVNLNLSPEGPHDVDETLPKLCRYYNIQVHIFTNVGNRRRCSYPSQFRENLPQIYLFEETYADEQYSHISLIMKLKALFKKHGVQCFRCPKQIKEYKRHRCCGKSERKTCFVCLRYLVTKTEEIYLDIETVKDYCIQTSQNLGYDKPCKKCGLVFKTADCQIAHEQSRTCKRGIMCQTCKRYVYGGQGINKHADILREHKCYHDRCRHCYALHQEGKEHSCQLQTQKPQSYYCNLAFFDLEATQNVTAISCVECLKKEKAFLDSHNFKSTDLKNKKKFLAQIRCKAHIDDIRARGYHQTNFCTCLFEDEIRGHFSLITFADPKMNHPEDCVIRKNWYINEDYLPENERKTPIFTKNVKASNFASNDSKISLPHELKTGPTLTRTEGKYFAREKEVHSSQIDSLESSENEDETLPAAKRLKIGDITTVLDIKEHGVLEKFWLFFGCEKFRNYTFLAHHASGYDSLHLCRSAFANSLTPSIVPRGNKILSMSIPCLNINILDSMQYTHCSLNKLASRYNLQQKDNFPHMFNKEENYEYSGKVPPLSTFCSETANAAIFEEKQKHVQHLEKTKYEWNFKNEINTYCRADTEILCKAMLLFLKEWFDIQLIFSRFFTLRKLDKNKKEFLHPFTSPFITFSSFIYGCYRLYECPQYDIRIINDEKGMTSINTSKGEMQYTLYQYEMLGRPKDFLSVYTSEKPPRIGTIFPDFYIPSKKIAGFFHGCIFHGHMSKNCDIVPPNSNGSTKNFLGYSFNALNDRFKKQCDDLLKDFEISEILVMWECQWNKFVRTRLANGIGLHQIQKRPEERLIPRTALRGGRVDTFQFSWSKDKAKNESLYYIDYNSLYPSVASSPTYPFPTGKMEVIINPDCLLSIFCENNKCYIVQNDIVKEIHGIGHVKILAPTHLEIPFLPYRVGPKSICALCRTCAVQSLHQPCKHSRDERAFTSVYTLPEIAYSVSLGYKVLQWFEVYAYFQSDTIFRKFLQVLGSYKIRYSGFPSDCKTIEEKRNYCQHVNKQMCFYHQDLQLSLDNVCDNRQLRDAFKLGSNSLLGKLSQDSDYDYQVNVSNQLDLNSLFYDATKDIVEIIPVSPHVVQTKVKSKSGFNKPNMKGNVILGAYVTASARIEMYKHFVKCQSVGADILYTDTDSMIIKIANNVEIPVPFGNAYGEFKHEVDGEILEFYSLGPKNYCLLVRDKKGETYQITKARGFFIKDKWSSEEINLAAFQQLLDDLLEKETETRRLVPQFNIRIEKNTKQLFSQLSLKTFRNNVYNKRNAFCGDMKSNFTMPYGYTENMLKKRCIKYIFKNEI